MSESKFFQVLHPQHPQTEKVRRTFSHRMGRLYSGWCDDYDRQFDAKSFIFTYTTSDQAEYSATCRVIFKCLAGREIATPSETADLNHFLLPKSSLTCCEGSMVSFKTPHDLRMLMYGVTKWLMINEVNEMYTTYDSDNPLTRRFFTRILGFVPIEGAIVRYQNFRVAATDKPAEWQVIKVNPMAEADNTFTRLIKTGVIPYDLPKEVPRLINWI